MMIEFQKSLPDGFREKLSSRVVTMSEAKIKKRIAEAKPVYNTEAIFARAMYLISIDRIDLERLFQFELASKPASLFKENGEARYTKSKSVIQRKLKVDVSSRTVSKPDVAVIDGGGMLHAAIYWPTEGIVKDLIDGIEKYVCSFINFADVYLVFDRYFEFSIKSDTRTERINSLLRAHTLSLEDPLPRKDTCMSSIETKEQLIQKHKF